MPTASYLRNNDYSIQDFKPFELPYSATLQELATKNAYWKQGAERIKASFDAVLGLDPQFAQHKDYLKNFTEQASKELTKAGKSDLAQDDNVGAAISIFKPLYDTSNAFNQNLLTDSQTNEFYKAQSKVANAARTANGGKTWNKNNEFYMQSGYQKYLKDAQSGDVNKVKENWSQKKGYIPYYDYSNDIVEARKNCHESGNEQTPITKDQLYFEKTSSEGITASAMQNCLQFLPPQAKQQIGIDSFAQYYSNKPGLLNDYKQLVYDRYNDERDAIQIQLTAANTTGNKELIANLKERLNHASDMAKRGETAWNGMVGKDANKFLEDNYESIASNVGVAHFVRDAGQAFSWQKNKHNLSPNAAGMMLAKQAFDARSQYQEFLYSKELNSQKHQYNLEEETLKLTGKDKNGKKLDGSLPDGTDPDGIQRQKDIIDVNAPENGEAVLVRTIDDNMAAMNTSIETVKQLIGEKLKNDPNNPAAKSLLTKLVGGKLPIATLLNFFKVYDDDVAKGGKKDETLSLALKTFRSSVRNFEEARTLYDAGNAKIKAIDLTKFDNKEQIEMGMINESGQQITLTRNDMAQIAIGHRIKGVSSLNGMGQFAAESLVYTDSKGKRTMWKDVNGNSLTESKDTSFSNTMFGEGNSSAGGSVRRLLNTTFGTFAKNMRTVYNEVAPAIEARKEVYKNNTLVADGYFTTGESDSKSIKNTEDILRNQLGISSDDNTMTVVSQFRDKDGTAYVRVNRKGKEGVAPTDLTQAKYTNNYEVVTLGSKGDGTQYLKIPRIYEALPSYVPGVMISKVDNFTKAAMDGLQSGHTSERTWTTESASGKEFMVEVTNVNGNPIYRLRVYNANAKAGEPKYQERIGQTPITSPVQLLTVINSL